MAPASMASAAAAAVPATLALSINVGNAAPGVAHGVASDQFSPHLTSHHLGQTHFFVRPTLFFYRVLPSFTEFYRVLPGFTGFYRVSQGFTRFYRVFLNRT